MASTSVSRVLPASPEQVWELIGGFHALPDWLPYIPESTMLEGGRVRRLVNPDGGVIVERLTAFSEAERYYTYAIVEGPFPATGYVSTLRVYPVPGREDAAEVLWSGCFTPTGVSESDVVALFTTIYRDGLAALHNALTR
ncbi:SRPBCC family protein [Herbidospora galbida]|uniref:SRPBCC family protein n=1 Tax=Herbidospora galbida TaxID=2575442 RepID=A0A4U3MRN7_9ACTN|nr:SRPBCC family protein [Herbidospora galbida]TKK91504.1 SRPBCC family protein [Herbidospora galbida]